MVFPPAIVGGGGVGRTVIGTPLVELVAQAVASTPPHFAVYVTFAVGLAVNVLLEVEVLNNVPLPKNSRMDDPVHPPMVIVTLSPEHTFVLSTEKNMVAMVILIVLLLGSLTQPAALVQVAEYVVDVVGLTVIELPGPPGDQFTVPLQPRAVNVVLVPEQIRELPAMMVGAAGLGFTVMVTGADAGLSQVGLAVLHVATYVVVVVGVTAFGLPVPINVPFVPFMYQFMVPEAHVPLRFAVPPVHNVLLLIETPVGVTGIGFIVIIKGWLVAL